MPSLEVPAVPGELFLGPGEPSVFKGDLRVSVIPSTLRALYESPGSAKGFGLSLVSFMRIPRFRSLRIAPGFYLRITRPVRSILVPQFLSIIPGFYLGFAAEYYF